MRRFLLITGIIPALLLSGWSGVLASALCQHAGGAAASSAVGEMPDCCRGEMGDGESCPMSRDESADEADAPHGASNTASEHAEATVEAAESGRAFNAPAIACAHCMGRSDFLPTPLFVREAAPAQRESVNQAPRAPKPLALPAAPLTRAVVPSQGAPPGHARRHVLISVFLI